MRPLEFVSLVLEVTKEIAMDRKELTEEDIELILEIAKERAAYLRQMKQAIENDNDAEALAIARRMLGLSEKGQ